ncbi:MAG: helix-hairpin-helix domain-containing protein [Opitutales bacterium]
MDETFEADRPARRKKKVDSAALHSAFMRIPGMKVEAARDLLDLGLDEVYQLEGRSPESLFSDLQKLRPETPADRVTFLRLAVYFAETDQPDPQRLHPTAWST